MNNLTQFQADLPQTDNFRDIVLKQTPLIDVRAPIEFYQGAFPSATNLPLMTDEERHKVGICYKQHGNAAAVKLGHQLVNNEVRAPRVQAWMDFMNAHPDALLYCFRGGMRSKISQQWLADQGHHIVRLKGGYKAFRRFLIDFLDQAPSLMQTQQLQPWILAGRTGSGKTQVIQRLSCALDLEALAHHRGSAFGRHATPQPTQINFENQLAMQLMRLMENLPHGGPLVIEDEARNIGSVAIPIPLFQHLKAGQRIIVDTPFAERVQMILQEYVIIAQAEYQDLAQWESFMLDAFLRIQKRLGGERYTIVKQQFVEALTQQKQQNELLGHETWISTLLSEYYDPMYDYQIQKNQQPIVFQGNAEDVVAFFQQKASH